MERVEVVYVCPSSRVSRACGGAPRLRPGTTISEILVAIGIIAVLVGVLIPVLSKARISSQNVACLSNLRQISVALQLYTNENRHCYPPPSDPNVSDQSWESFVKKYLSNKDAYHCPADGGMYDKMGSSYDWRDTGDTNTTLAGKMLSQIRRGNVVLAFDALPDWHAEGRINAVMTDGSSQTMDFQACLRDLDTPIAP